MSTGTTLLVQNVDDLAKFITGEKEVAVNGPNIVLDGNNHTLDVALGGERAASRYVDAEALRSASGKLGTGHISSIENKYKTLENLRDRRAGLLDRDPKTKVTDIDRSIADLEKQLRREASDAFEHANRATNHYDEALKHLDAERSQITTKMLRARTEAERAIRDGVDWTNTVAADTANAKLKVLDKNFERVQGRVDAFFDKHRGTIESKARGIEDIVSNVEYKSGLKASELVKPKTAGTITEVIEGGAAKAHGGMSMVKSVGVGVLIVDGLRRLWNAISANPGKNPDGTEKEAPGMVLPVVELGAGVAAAVMMGRGGSKMR